MNDNFKDIVWEYYHAHGRHMPWRDDPSFYKVLVSEVMLQQTQVQRVTPKFMAFMAVFPTVEHLAAAPLADVLQQWQGLGYNRRAKSLHEAAKMTVRSGTPKDMAALMALPGVGYNTAAAIMNYAYDLPVAFVETNIRTVYFYHFFPNRQDISDKEVVRMVEQTMPPKGTREWFWALMDYGSYLKQQGASGISASRHYKKQSRFEGSVRQARGRILAALIKRELSELDIYRMIGANDQVVAALQGLLRDGLIVYTNAQYHLTK